MSVVDWTLDENVAVLTMNSGENRFNIRFCTDMLEALDAIEKTTKASALVVRSSHEKIWSNGMDLDWLVPAMTNKDPDMYKFFKLQDALMRRMLFYPLITVAAITGHAFASGAIFSCCFDFRYMRSDRGFVCWPEVDLNIPFMPYMTAVIKKSLPRNLVEYAQLTGHRFTATELEECRFIRKACTMDEIMKEALAFAKTLNKSRWTVGEIKKVLHEDIAYMFDHPIDITFDPNNTPIK